MNKIRTLFFVCLLIVGCTETKDVIDIKQKESNLPIVLKYSPKLNTIVVLQFPLEYSIVNTSIIKRRLSNLTYHYKGAVENGSSRSYIKKGTQLVKIKMNNDYFISKNKPLKCVCYSKHIIRDTLNFSRSYFKSYITEMKRLDQDSIIISNTKKFKNSHSKLLEYLLDSDMVYIRFDDRDLRFVKESKMKVLLPGYSKDSIEIKGSPLFKIPVEW